MSSSSCKKKLFLVLYWRLSNFLSVRLFVCFLFLSIIPLLWTVCPCLDICFYIFYRDKSILIHCSHIIALVFRVADPDIICFGRIRIKIPQNQNFSVKICVYVIIDIDIDFFTERKNPNCIEGGGQDRPCDAKFSEKCPYFKIPISRFFCHNLSILYLLVLISLLYWLFLLKEKFLIV